MHRDNPGGVPILNDSGGNTIFNADDFSFDPQSGIDFALIHNFSDLYGIELRFLWIDPHRDEVQFAVPAGVNTIRTTPSTAFAGPSSGLGRFNSELNTFELNVRRTPKHLTLLGGFRYVDLDEQVSGHYRFGVGSETQTWATHNDLYGFQLGSELLLWDDGVRLRVQGIGKAGIYYNDARSSFLVERGASPAFSSDSNDAVAFLGEVGLYGTYQITRRLAVRAGYQLLWIDGVALAANQIPNTANFNVAGPIASNTGTSGNLFYHGANVGLELQW